MGIRLLYVLILLGVLASPAHAGRLAFVDPVTGVLEAHGFVAQNRPGDIAVPVAGDFALQPGRWRWTGSAWVPFTPPPTREERAQERLRRHVDAVLTDPTIPQEVKDAFNAIKDRLQ